MIAFCYIIEVSKYQEYQRNKNVWSYTTICLFTYVVIQVKSGCKREQELEQETEKEIL